MMVLDTRERFEVGGRGRCVHFAATTIAAFLLLSAAAARHPLDVSEKSSLGLVAYSVIQKYFFVLGMGMSLELDGDFVQVLP